MHPTLRHYLETTSRVVSRFLPGRSHSARAKSRRRARPELTALEDRMLLYFGVEATVVPDTLWPPNGRFVPVTVSGTFHEFAIEGTKVVYKKLPGPKKANFQVVDEYRQFEPAGPITMVDEGGGRFTFSFTIHLQAKRSTEFVAGRRYYITVAARDDDGWGAKTLAVQAPKSLQDRGPGPLQPIEPRVPTHAQSKGHPKGAAAHRRMR